MTDPKTLEQLKSDYLAAAAKAAESEMDAAYAAYDAAADAAAAAYKTATATAAAARNAHHAALKAQEKAESDKTIAQLKYDFLVAEAGYYKMDAATVEGLIDASNAHDAAYREWQNALKRPVSG